MTVCTIYDLLCLNGDVLQGKSDVLSQWPHQYWIKIRLSEVFSIFSIFIVQGHSYCVYLHHLQLQMAAVSQRKSFDKLIVHKLLRATQQTNASCISCFISISYNAGVLGGMIIISLIVLYLLFFFFMSWILLSYLIM